MTEVNSDAIKDLMVAVVKQACLDWFSERYKHGCEDFFRSESFSAYCNIDGDKLIQRLRMLTGPRDIAMTGRKARY